MIKPDQEVFLQSAMELKKRVLHPAEAIAVEGNEIQVVATDPNLPAEADQDIRVFHQARDFMQQTATIVNTTEEDGVKTLTIELTSKPASAENREFHRVSAVFAELTACVGKNDDCQLVDVSSMGFAVVSTQELQIGEIVETELRFEDQAYPGKTCVQSTRDLGAGRTRYGLLPLAEDVRGSDMFAGMQRMTTVLERKQLQRMSGAV